MNSVQITLLILTYYLQEIGSHEEAFEVENEREISPRNDLCIQRTVVKVGLIVDLVMRPTKKMNSS